MKRFSAIVMRNSAWGMAAQAAIKVASFAFSVLIVRRLGVSVYGQYAGVLAFGATFAIFSDLGLSPYAVREVARWRGKPDGQAHIDRLYGNMLWLRGLLAAATAVMVTGAAWLSGRPLLMVGAIALSTVGLLLYSVEGTSEAALSGFERIDLASGAKVLNQLVFVGLGAVVLLSGTGYYGLILGNITGVALMTYVCWQGARRLGVKVGRPDWRAWWPLIRAALPFGVIGFALGLSYKYDSVLLSVFRSDTETGYYNAAYNLVFSAVVLSNVFNTALYPSLARQAVSHPESLPRIYERALRYLMVMALPIAAGGWVLARPLVSFLFTAAYAPAAPLLAILIWVVPLMFASEFLGYVVVVSGHEQRVARAVVVSTCVNVAVNTVLVPRLGFFAAAVMTVITEVVLVAQYLWLLRSLLKKFAWSKILGRPLLATGVMLAVVLALRGLPLLVDIGIGAAVYGVMLLALRVLGPDELRLLRGARQKVPSVAVD
jgi:O-antigen/teichoic acid export membrane protein